jgi:hypothetical protein
MQDESVKGLYPGGVVLQMWGPPPQPNPAPQQKAALWLATCQDLARLLLPKSALEKLEVRVHRSVGRWPRVNGQVPHHCSRQATTWHVLPALSGDVPRDALQS